MSDQDIARIVEIQREFFSTGITRELAFRLDALRELRETIESNMGRIETALMDDLNKHPQETYMSEVGLVLSEISYHSRHLRGWMREKRVLTPLAQFKSSSFISPEPYGVCLIMSPWNYPIQLTLAPLVGAISAGNCAVVKPSAYAENTSHLLAQLIEKTFPKEYITVVEGGREQNSSLLDQRFDKIFFTGSVKVGKVVMEAASRNLTPVTLELGGKSPVIVDATADIKLAARRIAFGKVLNAGQTCVAPDYVLCHKSVMDKFLYCYQRAIDEFFPGGDMSEMPTIVNQKHFDRLMGLMQGCEVAVGGRSDASRRLIEPTVLVNVDPDMPVMQEEIFGPILPVIGYSSIDECIRFINSRPKPLALYLFTRNSGIEGRILTSCSFGGGCINDTIVHLATSYMPFGGVGESGMGDYHGKASFDAFTHYRSILKKSNLLDLPMRYHPYEERNLRIIRMLMR
ncbi:MAG: aldehyde dehydrogenase [Coriobacteriales bacterium]